MRLTLLSILSGSRAIVPCTSPTLGGYYMPYDKPDMVYICEGIGVANFNKIMYHEIGHMYWYKILNKGHEPAGEIFAQDFSKAFEKKYPQTANDLYLISRCQK